MGDLSLENWETSLWKIWGRPLHWKNGGRHCVRPPPPPENIVSRPCVHDLIKCTRFCSIWNILVFKLQNNPQTKFFSPTFLRELYRYFFNMIFDISWNIIDGSFFNSFDCNQIKSNQIIYLAIKYMYRWIFIINNIISRNYSLWQGDGTSRNCFLFTISL